MPSPSRSSSFEPHQLDLKPNTRQYHHNHRAPEPQLCEPPSPVAYHSTNTNSFHLQTPPLSSFKRTPIPGYTISVHAGHGGSSGTHGTHSHGRHYSTLVHSPLSTSSGSSYSTRSGLFPDVRDTYTADYETVNHVGARDYENSYQYGGGGGNGNALRLYSSSGSLSSQYPGSPLKSPSLNYNGRDRQHHQQPQHRHDDYFSFTSKYSSGSGYASSTSSELNSPTTSISSQNSFSNISSPLRNLDINNNYSNSNFDCTTLGADGIGRSLSMNAKLTSSNVTTSNISLSSLKPVQLKSPVPLVKPRPVVPRIVTVDLDGGEKERGNVGGEVGGSVNSAPVVCSPSTIPLQNEINVFDLVSGKEKRTSVMLKNVPN
ncbi:hypothetical protein HDU76_010855, partial [Blyttiomyces sp. JEL0837]